MPRRDSWVLLTAVLAVALVVWGKVELARANRRAEFQACLANLKNLATAMEMYSTDHEGRFPSTLDALVPFYLREVPRCPAVGRDTYAEGLELGPRAQHNQYGHQDYYYLHCSGANHRGASPGSPWLDGVTALCFRDEEQELRARGWRG